MSVAAPALQRKDPSVSEHAPASEAGGGMERDLQHSLLQMKGTNNGSFICSFSFHPITLQNAQQHLARSTNSSLEAQKSPFPPLRGREGAASPLVWRKQEKKKAHRCKRPTVVLNLFLGRREWTQAEGGGEAGGETPFRGATSHTSSIAPPHPHPPVKGSPPRWNQLQLLRLWRRNERLTIRSQHAHQMSSSHSICPGRGALSLSPPRPEYSTQHSAAPHSRLHSSRAD